MAFAVKDWKDSPDATTPISQAALEDMESRLSAYTDTVASNPLGVVRAGTVLPTSPTDGQLFTYNADTTNGIKWLFQYRAASASAFKWEFVGGAPLTANVDAAQSVTANGSWNDPATTNISITLPFAGDYRFEFRLALLADAARVTDAGVAVGAAAPNTALERFIEMPTVSTAWYTNTNICRVTGAAASAVAKLQLLQSAGTLQVRGARLNAHPIRIG